MSRLYDYTITLTFPENTIQFHTDNRIEAITTTLEYIEGNMYDNTAIDLIDNYTGEVLLYKKDDHGSIYFSSDTLSAITAIMKQWGK